MVSLLRDEQVAVFAKQAAQRTLVNYAVVFGTIKLVLYDDRTSSPTKGQLMEIFLGDGNYSLVKVPPLVWNGFKGVGTTPAIVANCSTIPHNPNESDRLDPHNNHIPYTWETVEK